MKNAAKTTVIFVGLLAPSALGTTLLGPTPYQSFADSPFRGVAFQSFGLEDFEDGLLNTPGVASTTGTVNNPNIDTDSVDGDDGLFDGRGSSGHSWYSNNLFSVVTFTFSPVGGELPTHAGVVWTDVGFVSQGSNGFANVFLEAFGPTGNSLGTTTPALLGDGNVQGGTGEDRFLGVIDLGGISRIEIHTDTSLDWEVDHVQFGVVPAPTGLALAAVAGAFVNRRRR